MLSAFRDRLEQAAPGSGGDRGDTLVEVLVAVVIVGTAVVALLGGLLATTTTSVSHRKQATIDAALASFAETARSAVELNPPGGFVPCSPGNPVTYTIVGSPNPRSGPAGSLVDVFGTGFTVAQGSPIGGATFGGSALAATAMTTSSAGSTSGALSEFTVPSKPAGTYVVTPFDGTHASASSFTITPWLGPMSPAGAGSGPGSPVKVSVTGFGAAKTLTVTVGTTAVAAGAVSGNPTSATGVANLTFTIPTPLAGSQTSQPVTISDGTNSSSPETLFLGNDSGVASQLQTVSNYATETLTATTSYWNPSSGANWTTNAAFCTGASFNPNIEQLAFKIVDNQSGNGADGGVNIVVANFNAQAAPAPPVNLTATSYKNAQVPLQWAAPGYTGTSPITGYNVYRSTVSGALGTKITTTAAGTTSYTDNAGLTNGTTYYYAITAVNSSGESAPSTPQVSAVPATTPSAPTSVTASPGNTKVTVNWSPPASNGGAAVNGYNIYRSALPGVQGVKVGSVGSSTTTFTDTGLTNGLTYYYEVTATNPAGEGPTSPQVSATPNLPPNAPTNLTATPGNATVQLSWTAPVPNTGPAVTQYNVYRSTTSGAQGAVIGTTAAGTTTFSDSGLTNGTTYYYEVTAVNSIGEGNPSNQASATPIASPTAPSPPTLNSATRVHVSGSTYNVSLSWSAPGSNGGSPLTGYTVYRSLTQNGAYVSVGTTGPATTTFTDTTVTHGTTYWYYIVANNSVGPSSPSNKLSVTA